VYPNNPNTKEKELVALVEKETGEAPPTGHVYIGYSIIQMLAKAMEMTGGNTESEALAEAMSEFTEVPTLVGNTTYTTECHVPKGRNLAITQIVNGKGKYVETITPKEEYVPEAPC
jgi:ABC-type branched-subunit amino acid transport system substrate-binding protein